MILLAHPFGNEFVRALWTHSIALPFREIRDLARMANAHRCSMDLPGYARNGAARLRSAAFVKSRPSPARNRATARRSVGPHG
jgi:hypothetical protein